MSGADGSVLIDTKLDDSGLEKGLKGLEGKAGSTLGKLGSTVAKGAAAAVGAISTALVAAGTSIVKTGMEFEAQMSRVNAISGATAVEFQALGDLAKQLGADTSFSATEAAAGMENLASAGFTANEIMAAMPGLLDLAAVSGGNVAMAADVAATALRAFGLDASQAGHVADVFAKAAADTNAEALDMGEAMKYVAPIAKAMGISLEETAAAIGIMSDAGIKGSQAGTSLRGALSRLAKPTKAMRDVMQDLGISFYDTKGQMLPLKDQMGMLKEAFEGLTQEEINHALVTLYGQESLSGMLALIEAGPDKIDELTQSLVNADGAAAEFAAIMKDNLAGDWEEFGGSLETLQLTIYEKIAPALRTLVQYGNESVDALTEAFYKGYETGGLEGALNSVLDTAGKILGEIITEIVVAAPKIVKATTNVIKALVTELSKSASKIGNAAADIGTELIIGLMEIIPGLLDTAILLVVNFAEGLASNLGPLVAAGIKMIAELALSLIRAAPRIIQAIPAIIRHLIDGFAGVDWAGLWDELVTSFQDAWTMLKSAGLELWEQLKGIDWAGIWESIQTVAAQAWDTIKTAFVNAWEAIKGIDWGQVWESAKAALSSLGSLVKELFTGDPNADWKDVASAAWGGVKTALEALGSLVKVLITGKSDATWEDVAQAAWDGVKTAASTLGSLLIALVTGDGTATWDDTASAIWGGVQTALSSLGSLLKELITGDGKATWTDTAQVVWSGVQTAFSTLGSLLKYLITGNGDASWTDVAGKIHSGVQKALATLGSLFKQLVTGNGDAAWSDVASKIRSGVETALATLGSLVKVLITGNGNATWDDVAQKVWDGVNTALGGLGSLLKELVTGDGKASWGDVAEKIWSGLKSAFESAGHSILDLLGLSAPSSLSSDNVKNIVGSFKLPESFKMLELQEAQSNIANTITELGKLKSEIGKSVLEVKLGVKMSDEQATSFGEMLDKLVTSGLETINENQYNMNLQIASLFGEGSENYDTVMNGLFNPFFEQVEGKAKEAAEKLISAYAEAMATGGITPEAAANIARLAEQFEFEVQKAIADRKMKAKLAQLTFEADLKGKDIEEIVNDAYKVVGEAFEAAKGMREDRLEIAWAAVGELKLDREATGKYIGIIQKEILDELSGISLEGLGSVWESIGSNIDVATILGQFEKMGGAVAGYFGPDGNFAKQTGGAAENAVLAIVGKIGNLDLPVREQVQSLVKALEPNIADMNEVKALYEQAGLEIPESLARGFEMVDLLSAIGGNNTELFNYIRESVRVEMDETGADAETAMASVLERMASVLTDGSLLSGALETLKDDMAVTWDDVFNTSLVAIKDWQPLLQQQLEEAGTTAGELLGMALPAGVKVGLENGKVIVRDAAGEIVDLASLASQQAELNAQSLAAGEEGTENVGTGMGNEEPTVTAAAQGVKDAAVDPLEPLPGEMTDVATEAMGGMTGAITDATGDISDAAGTAAEAGVSAASGVLNEGSGQTVGNAFGQGIASGITASTATIVSAATAAAQAAYSAAMAALDAHSPSRLMRYVGEYVFGGGFALGIEDATQDVAAEAAHLSKAAADALESRLMLDVDFDAAALVRRAQAALDREQLTLTAVMDASTGGGNAFGGVGTTTVMIGPIEVYTESIDDEADMDYLARRIGEEASIQARYKGVIPHNQ